MQVQKGPYIFASCHEDVLEYLQPQYVCLCLPGSAPRLLKNPHEGQLPSLHATITGVTEPIGHHLVGSWMPKNKKIQPFLITHKAPSECIRVSLFFLRDGTENEELSRSSHVTDVTGLQELTTRETVC